MNNTSIVAVDYNGLAIATRKSDGWVNLTQMCKATGARIDNWLRLAETQVYIETLTKTVGTIVIETKKGRGGGTWVHPDLATNLIRWMERRLSYSDSEYFEENHQRKIAQSLNGELEVPTKTGRIDVLTATEVIEVKEIKAWKSAVGQVLIYQLEFPDRQARIHLYGKCSDDFKQMIISYSARLNILVTFAD